MEDNYTFNVDIETQKSTTSVASLRKEVKDLKDQLLNLEEGTEDYNRVLQECANKTHTLKEMNEELRASAADVGERLGNMSRTLAGISGGVQVVTSGLSLMGVEMGKDNELMKTLVSLMSMTQGFQAIDSGVKAFARLTRGTKMATVAMKGLSLATKAIPWVAIGAGIYAVVKGLIDWANAANDAYKEQARLNREAREAALETARQAGSDQLKELEVLIAKKKRLWTAEGRSEIEIARRVQQEYLKAQQDAFDKRNAAIARQGEIQAEVARQGGWSEINKILNKNGESLGDYYRSLMDAQQAIMDTANAFLTELGPKLENAQEDIRIAGIEAATSARRTAEEAKTAAGWYDLAGKKAANWFDVLKKGYRTVGQDGKMSDPITPVLERAEKAAPELADKIKAILDPNALYESSKTWSDILKGLVEKGVATKDEMLLIWKAMIDGNDEYLVQMEGQMESMTTYMQLKGASQLDIQKRDLEVQAALLREKARLWDDEVQYYKKTEDKEDDVAIAGLQLKAANARIEADLLQKRGEALQKYYDLEQEYILKQRELAGGTDTFTFWDWQYQNQYDNYMKSYELQKAQLDAEMAYQLKVAELATETGDKDTQDEAFARIAELTDQLNNLNLDKSKATFKAWGDSVVKILGNVTDVMGSLMSYYQTQTDEAVADLEDKLEQNLISQEDYDRESEKLKEEQFERNKQFQIAQALINGAAGIVQIIGDASLPSYWAKLAAIAATTLTTGIQVAAIQAQHYHSGKSSGGSSSGSGNGENWINVAPAYQMNDGTDQAQMTGAAVGNQLNSQRVYILESDIQSSNRRVQVRESNTRF